MTDLPLLVKAAKVACDFQSKCYKEDLDILHRKPVGQLSLQRNPETLMPEIGICDGSRNTAFIKVGPEGGMFRIPYMGMQMLFPPNAVDQMTTLRVSIQDYFHDFPDVAMKWSVVTPRVKIEPDDIEYNTEVYLIINHSLQVELSRATCKGNPVLLHSNNEKDAWKVVNSSLNNPESLEMPVDNNKRAFLTATSVIVSMKTNCTFCLFSVTDELGVERPAMRLKLMVFADYQPDGGNLNIRVYAAHDLSHRISTVNVEERESYGGHRIGGKTVCVLHREKNPLSIDVSVNGGETHVQQIDYDMIRVELDQSRGSLPCADFVVPVSGQEAAAAPPTSACIRVTATQCTFKKTTIVKQEDLASLRKMNPGKVPTRISLDRDIPDECYAEYTPLSDNRSGIMYCLQENLKDNEIEAIKKFLEIEDSLEDLDENGKRKFVLDMFVRDLDAGELVPLLESLGILRDEVREHLQSFIKRK